MYKTTSPRWRGEALEPIAGLTMKSITIIAALFWLIMLCSMQARAEETEEAQLRQHIVQLANSSFTTKGEAVDALIASDDERVAGLLQALQDGVLYLRKDDKQVFVIKEKDAGYSLHDPLTGVAIGNADSDVMKKIILNNQLRVKIRDAMARFQLFSRERAQRLSAVQQLIERSSPEMAPQLQKALGKESDALIKEKLALALALIRINDSDNFERLHAVEILGQSLEPAARAALDSVFQKENLAEDKNLYKAVQTALASIKRKLALNELLETFYFGISLGSVLLLAAIGLAITFGVMGVINMAHGELIMLGAYTTYVVQQLMPNHIGLSLLVAIPAAFIVSGLVGIAIERGVIRFLYGRPLETLLATFGVSLILQQAVRTIFTPLNRQVETPSWMSGSFDVNGALSLTYNRFYIIIFSILVFLALLAILKRTALGLQVRAVAQNRQMARAMGIRTERVDALTFGLGSGIAGVAGVALSQLTNVGPNLGQSYIIDSFMVVVFGGVGNLWGTLVAAMSLGVVNKILEPFSGAVLAKILVLVFIILFIQKRPRGLFPQKGRAAEG